jgi:Ca2+-binding RTX toxin-like protein
MNTSNVNTLAVGEGGNDTLVGGIGANTIFGGVGNDQLTGNIGIDYSFLSGSGSTIKSPGICLLMD